MVKLHCEIRRNRDGVYEAVCLENSVATFDANPRIAKRKLERALRSYFEDIAEELERLISAGELDGQDEAAVIRELYKYMQPVKLYPLRLARWQFEYLCQELVRPRPENERTRFYRDQVVCVP